jgi:NADP-dependent 3-hydroxy acid dehydrogenase YdfG
MTKYLVITGGSKGIGEKTASVFIEKGWRVINIARTACNINEVTNFSIDLSS